jgi:hypothetical protein
MNKEKQRVAIAEACGWHDIKYRDCSHGDYAEYDWTGFTQLDKGWDRLPDYINDLNGMHEAEKMLFPKFAHKYKLALADLKGFSGNNHDKIWHATASQRAEAFLKTIEKWEEDDNFVKSSNTNAAHSFTEGAE